MNQTTRSNLDDVSASLTPFEAILMLLAVSGGALAAAVFLPMWLPGLSESLLGSQPKAYWYLARASGFVAYIMLWLSIALGLIITNKMARLWNSGPTAVDLHQFTTWLAVAVSVFHGLILLGDHYIKATPDQVLIPFAYVNYKPIWVGAGQIALYLTVIVAASFFVRKRIGYHTWRLLHYASFLVYAMITVHAIYAGTDAAALTLAYLGGGFAIYFLFMFRIFYSGRMPAPARPATAVPRAALPTTRPSPAVARPSLPKAEEKLAE